MVCKKIFLICLVSEEKIKIHSVHGYRRYQQEPAYNGYENEKQDNEFKPFGKRNAGNTQHPDQHA